MGRTTDDFLRSVKRKAFTPKVQNTLTDDDILEIATDELYDRVVPDIISAREEYYVTHKLVAVATDSSGERYVKIPERAVGGILREIKWMNGDIEADLPRVDLEDRQNLVPQRAFYVEGNRVKFLSSEIETVKLYYLERPGGLVKSTAAGLILQLDYTNNNVIVQSVPNDWFVGTEVDFIEGQPGYSTITTAVAITGISGTTVEFAVLPQDLSINDWVTTANTSPVVQVPNEYYSYLAQLTASQILESQGDLEAKQLSDKKASDIGKRLTRLITPRIEGEAEKIVPYYNKATRAYRW